MLASSPSPDPWPGLLLLGAAIIIYFLPSIAGRKKQNHTAIFALNFFLGWTIVGWIVPLVWALTVDPAVKTQVIVGGPPTGVLCSACGKYSVPGSKFCNTCGAGPLAN
jgi:hypothetical protein